MNPNLYLKAFLAGFAPGFLIYLLSNYEKTNASLMAIFYGVLFGIILLIFALIHYLVSSRKTGNAEDAMKVRHQRDLDMKITEAEVFGLIRAYAEEMKYKIREERPNTFLLCKTPFNLKTFGNLLSFEITAAADNVTHVKIVSEPWIGTTLIDYGDSLGRIQQVEEYLKSK